MCANSRATIGHAVGGCQLLCPGLANCPRHPHPHTRILSTSGSIGGDISPNRITTVVARGTSGCNFGTRCSGKARTHGERRKAFAERRAIAIVWFRAFRDGIDRLDGCRTPGLLEDDSGQATSTPTVCRTGDVGRILSVATEAAVAAAGSATDGGVRGWDMDGRTGKSRCGLDFFSPSISISDLWGG